MVIVAHRDRLVRFGFEWFEAFCERHGTSLVVIDGDKLSPEKEMVEDLLAILSILRSVPRIAVIHKGDKKCL
jgi:predicted site-specific integrase-resolvase